MDAYTLSLAATIWGIASAIAVATLAGTTLAGGKSRPRGALAFGLFGILWSIQIILVNATRVVFSEDAAVVMHLASIACLLPLPYFLVEFASAQRNAPGGGWRLLKWTAAATALVAGAALIAAPDLIFQGVRPLGDRILPRYGPLHVPLVTLPFFLSFAVALLALHQARRESPTPRTARQAQLLLAGLGVYVAFAAGNNLVFFTAALPYDTSLNTLLFSAVFALLTAVTLYVGVSAVLAARRAGLRDERRSHHFTAAAMLVPLAWGACEAWLALERFPLLESVGLWRLAGVAIIAYGIARWRIYDLPQRTTRVAADAGGTLAAAATGAAAYGAGTLVSAGPAVPVVVSLAVLAAVYLPSVRFARRLFRIDEPKPALSTEEASYGQRIDAYRAALEASIARGTLDEDTEFLGALRARFNISEAEERVLLHYARSSVVVFRDRKAWEAYERLRLLGEGGGGRTWLARDRNRDRLVVLKEPLERWQQEPAVKEAVLREARLAARVRHPNVVGVEEVVEANGSPVIVMEYLEGGSLRDLLRSRGTLPWREAVSLCVDVLRGVEAVHAAGIIHRDLKPSNILLDGRGSPKIADFGIAVPQNSNRTLVDGASTQRAGTYLYMAPEVRNGLSIGDKRSDLYACAVLLHECLYGAPPGAGSPVVVRHDIPPALTELIARGMSERPEERPLSARAFADDLARTLR